MEQEPYTDCLWNKGMFIAMGFVVGAIILLAILFG